MSQRYLFTSESVSEGHPDKMCDQVSDAILDAYLREDPKARVAAETFTTTGLVLVGGEVKSSARVEIEDIVRDVVKEIGYDHSDKGFDYATCSVALERPISFHGVVRALWPRGYRPDLGTNRQGGCIGGRCRSESAAGYGLSNCSAGALGPIG